MWGAPKKFVFTATAMGMVKRIKAGLFLKTFPGPQTKSVGPLDCVLDPMDACILIWLKRYFQLYSNEHSELSFFHLVLFQRSEILNTISLSMQLHIPSKRFFQLYSNEQSNLSFLHLVLFQHNTLKTKDHIFEYNHAYLVIVVVSCDVAQLTCCLICGLDLASQIIKFTQAYEVRHKCRTEAPFWLSRLTLGLIKACASWRYASTISCNRQVR